MSSLASVIVPTRGGAKRLPTLLRALERQNTDAFEVIVVVDGDIDGSASVARAWEDRLRMVVIDLPTNNGRSVALNSGLEAAAGDVLIRCDDDLEPSPDWVAGHVDLHQHGERGVVGLYRNIYPLNAYTRVYAQPTDARFRREAYAVSQESAWRYWAGNVSVTRDVWGRVGPYDTAYRAYGFEDVDWGYRLHRLGIPVVLAPGLETIHHSPATSARIRAARAFHSGAARNTFEAIHGVEVLGSGGQDPEMGLWGRANHAVGRRLDRDDIDRMGGLADRLARVLPRYAAEKVIAFTVEAAAEAGRSRPTGLDLSI